MAYRLTSDCFSPDFFTAKNRFREIASKAGARLHSLPLAAKGPGGEALEIDVAWFGEESPRKVFFHSSGLHGIEGFAGSAIQLQLLQSLPPVPSGAALVVAHVLNPYGMAWLRRVNENNVDLNRNCRPDGSYSGAPPLYSELNDFLNPVKNRAMPYLMEAVWLLLRHGMAPLKQTIAGGQYEFPKGLFFGGRQLEEAPQKIEAFLEQRLSRAESVVAIDVHSGLGPFGEDSLLVAPEDFVRIRDVFGERVKSLEPQRGPAYRVEGGLESMMFRLFRKVRPIFIGQEFGTYSAIRVFRALREENRWHHYGGGGLDHPSKRVLKEMFCPEDRGWRERVLQRGVELVTQALGNSGTVD